jgi:glycerol-3-phosphate acyltransferase PlsY
MALTLLWVAACLVGAYLIGGIPFGAIVARRFYGLDITKEGSGNTGATNVFRALGWRAALPVALLDIAKGVVPAAIARYLAFRAGMSVNASDLIVVMAGVSAMLGHMYSPYFRLRGGKGIATAAGGMIVAMPWAFVVELAVFVTTILLARIVSVASLVTAALFPLVIWVLSPGRPVLFVFALIGVPLVFWAHRANIGRIFRREEPRITMGTRKQNASDGGE